MPYTPTHMKTKEELMIQIEGALDMVREGLAMHRGGVDLIDLDVATGVATVRMRGMCVGCPMSGITMKEGIEEAVRMAVPEVTSVVAADPLQDAQGDHAAQSCGTPAVQGGW